MLRTRATGLLSGRQMTASPFCVSSSSCRQILRPGFDAICKAAGRRVRPPFAELDVGDRQHRVQQMGDGPGGRQARGGDDRQDRASQGLIELGGSSHRMDAALMLGKANV